MIQIIEQCIKSKIDDSSLCEDAIFCSNDFIAVIDGTTNKSQKCHFVESPGSTCALLISQSLKNLEKTATAREAVHYLSHQIQSLYKTLGLEQHMRENVHERVSSSIMMYSKFRRQIWSIGDCQCMTDGKLYRVNKKVDTTLALLRSFYLHTEIKRGKHAADIQSDDVGRSFIIPLLERQCLFQNVSGKSEWGYGVIDGFDIPDKYIKTIDVRKADTIVLATDGYPKLFPSLQQSETYLAQYLEKDPFCIGKHKSTKGMLRDQIAFDDRAYIKFRTSNTT